MARNNKSPTKDKSPSSPHTHGSVQPFPVVGIGASAGGLEAFESFFDAMPSDSGIAFVVVAHLDPTHISLLPELLQKHTEMQIFQVEDGMSVQRNTVYIIPPNRDLNLLNGQLQLRELKHPRGKNLPIDSFFSSLAEDQGANAACIVLSGTGSDGTLGLRAIKGKGGLTIVQNEESARYDGMPQNAAATGLADFVLPPEQMPNELISRIQNGSRRSSEPKTFIQETPNSLQKVFALLRTHTHHDFSLYKENTIIRRIERRIHLHHFYDIDTYLQYLQTSESEIGILFKELLIGVTSFFRDPLAFAKLKETLLDQLRDKPADYTFRVWVPGCSTGEEAYSIAILLQECMEELSQYFQVQIFGTDIDEEAIDTARKGLYPASITDAVEFNRLARFFHRGQEGYQIQKSIREILVFATQSVIRDPPFTKLDLLSCRNLMIYFNNDLQQKILPIFHYSLKPGGTMFLGSSETIGSTINLHTTIDKKWKIFTRNPQTSALYRKPDFPVFPLSYYEKRAISLDTPEEIPNTNAIALVESILHQSNAPPCVIIDAENKVVYIHGRVGHFLEPAIGRATTNILEMARPGLKSELITAIQEVHTHQRETLRKALNIEQDKGHTLVDIRVKPLAERPPLNTMIMIVFETVGTPSSKASRSAKTRGQKTAKVDVNTLELELQSTRENLQTTIEELETTNEELKSTNEELQSTNEELETSKEELQSLNEESITVNSELQSRVDQLVHANDDMKNLLDSTQVATLFLKIDLCIHRFTPKMTEIISLTTNDIGRPITDLAINLLDTDIKALAQQVLDDLIPITREVISKDYEYFLLRILPYRTANNLIDGIVITLDNITKQIRIEEKLSQSEHRYRLVLENAPLTVAQVDLDLRYTWIHNGHPDFEPAAYLGKRDDEIDDNEGIKELMALKQRVIDNGTGASAEISFPLSGGSETYSIAVEPLKDANDLLVGATSVAVNITGHKRSADNS